MPMRVTTQGNIGTRIRSLSRHIDSQLPGLVSDIVEFGDRRMTELVPKGATGRLAAAVSHEGPAHVGPLVTGRVYVDTSVAPEAKYVQKGTGIDGPMRIPVTITRPSFTNPNRPGVMRFQKQGEPPRFRRTVKIIPSSKIEAGKDFAGKTYRSMVAYTRGKTVAFAQEIAHHIAGTK